LLKIISFDFLHLIATVIMAPVLVIIVAFSILFYRRIVKHQYVISSMKYEELEKLHRELERVSSVHSMSYQNTITSNYKTWVATQEPHRHHNHHHHHPHHQYINRNPNGSSNHMNADSKSMVETPLSPTASDKSFSLSVITVWRSRLEKFCNFKRMNFVNKSHLECI